MVEIVSQFTRKDLTLDRREVARMSAGVVFGSALLEPLERWLTGGTEKSRAGRSGSVGYHEVEQIENAARVFRDWDDQFGGGLRRKAVVGQLSEIADLLRDSHPVEIRNRLFGAMAQLAETAAMMSWDSGYQALAQRYYVLSFRASKAAGDRVFGAYIMAAMARQLLYLDHAGDALELVRLAQGDSADYATASVRSMLYTREAWAYAKLMEEASHLAHQAAALVEQTSSDRVRVKLAGLYQHSNAHADVPVIASLRDRIRSLCAAQTT
jgi:hypothetical protein